METRSTYKIVISDDERRKFKMLAKSKGMTVQGYIAQLIKHEINNELPSDINSHLSDRIQGTATPGALDFGSR